MKFKRSLLCSALFATLLSPVWAQDITADPKARDAYNRGLQFFAAGQLNQALQAFDEAAQHAPKDPMPIYQSGVTHQGLALFVGSMADHQKELELAEAQFNKAIELNPKFFDALIHVANVQSELKKYQESLKNLLAASVLPDVSEINQQQTQQAIAFVKSQLASASATNTTTQSSLPPQIKAPTPTQTGDTENPGTATESASDAMPPEASNESANADDSSEETASANQSAPPSQDDQMGMPVGGYTTFVDPSERSFTVEVPAGWNVEGGLTRASAIDCRPWVRVTSPDKMIVAFIGDGTIAPATCPTAQLSALGFGVGSKYMGGLVLPYIPARNFAEKYARMKLKPYTKDIQILSEANHPELAHAINGTVGCTHSHCASIKLSCTVSGIPAIGYYLACTKANITNLGSMWWVSYIAGELSPADREGIGLAVALHMMKTFQMDPAWKQQSLQTTAAVSANYRRTANAISKSISDRYWSQQAFNDRMNASYWKQQAVYDKAANNFSDHIRDHQNVADPYTGNQYKVYQANEHWIDPGGSTIMGTDGGAPGPDWRQLNNVP